MGANAYFLDWVNDQADLGLYWAHMPFCWCSWMHVQLVIRRLQVRPLPASNSLPWRLILKYFYGHSLLSADKDGQLSVSIERMSAMIVNHRVAR